MKLPLAKLNTVKLQSLKLQSLKPFKQIASKLSSLEHTRIERTRNLARVRKEKSAYRMALTLLLVRPWVLVMGFWLFSLGIGTLALGGMLSPRRLTMALPEPAVDASIVTASQSAGDSSANPSTTAPSSETDSETASEADNETTSAAANAAESPQENTVSSVTLALPLLLLVSTCAVGCFVISRRRTMKMAVARARVRKARSGLTVSGKMASSKAGGSKAVSGKADGAASRSRPLASSRPRTKAPARKLSKPRPASGKIDLKIFPQKANSPANNLASSLGVEHQPRKRRQRSKRAIAARTTVKSTATGGKELVSRATVARANRQPKQAAVRPKRVIRSASRRPASQPTVVSVMPAGESHALDWQERSLAHRMDVRPHRSAM